MRRSSQFGLERLEATMPGLYRACPGRHGGRHRAESARGFGEAVAARIAAEPGCLSSRRPTNSRRSLAMTPWSSRMAR